MACCSLPTRHNKQVASSVVPRITASCTMHSATLCKYLSSFNSPSTLNMSANRCAAATALADAACRVGENTCAIWVSCLTMFDLRGSLDPPPPPPPVAILVRDPVFAKCRFITAAHPSTNRAHSSTPLLMALATATNVPESLTTSLTPSDRSITTHSRVTCASSRYTLVLGTNAPVA
ncbi:hypothetical protein BCR44DRAFT_1277195 [Catenaria anguillulae PL171]|uniref:Uncharacterized protein n=1 Tax=Catenaria anguillulae PL171 TaxID=765915 RepID=A0A1Y2H9C1_9FUNG|nr:hypothetical protein BCR44DRAFT_1277195 [Catenaria anguillulae PL171]